MNLVHVMPQNIRESDDDDKMPPQTSFQITALLVCETAAFHLSVGFDPVGHCQVSGVLYEL